MALLALALGATAMAAPGSERPRSGSRAAGEALLVIKENCFSCHNEEKKKGGLILTARETVIKGGNNGPVVEPGKPDRSLLIQALEPDSDPHMPPKQQLDPGQIRVLRDWIRQGLPWDDAALLEGNQPLRPVALDRLSARYQPVLALAVSPDGSRLAVGSGSRVVLYSLQQTNYPILAVGEAHPDPVQSLAWSPDGLSLASGAFRRIVFWNAETLEPVRWITAGFSDRIRALAFVPGGDRLILADGMTAQSGIVRLVDVARGEVIRSWRAHADNIFALALSPDGQRLATGGGDKLVRVWDWERGREIARLEGHTGTVLALAFNPTNATQLASGGADQQLKVWDVATREKILSPGNHKGAVTGLAWVRDGTALLAINDAGQAFRYTDFKAHTGAQSSQAANEKRVGNTDEFLEALAATPDGDRMIAGSNDGNVHIWNGSGKLLATLAARETLGPVPVALASSGDGAQSAGAPLTFTRDVLPVLSRAGCNAGACHAKPEGQNGFKLSVFSYDPKSDYQEIAKEARGRRVFPAAPDESLILLKPTQSVPHEGGRRFERDSEAYRTLRQWISQGLVFRGTNEPALERLAVFPPQRRYRPGSSQRLRVLAHYSDGSTRDVTELASYASNDKEIAGVDENGLVTVGTLSGQAVVVARFLGLVGDSHITVPAERILPEERYAQLPVNNYIDELAYAQFRRLGLFPSRPCNDAEFLRRASLDTLGVLPKVEEARAFLADPDPKKREKWIERLLEHPAYADYWAHKWADLLRPNPDRVGVKSVYLLDQWLRSSFRQNKPYDQFVREILLLEGSNHRAGPAVIYRDRREPADLTTMFSQVFLGVRLECARCHHHPNEKWGQDDFYRLAAFFGAVKQKGAGLSPPISAGTETFYFAGGGAVRHPVTGEVMEPQPPDGPPMKPEPDEDPRRALADWMTAPENPYFARAVANRLWAAFFGRGLVEPVDDFRISNPPSNAELIEALGNDLARNGFDLKRLMRAILQSRLYQLSSEPNEFNLADTRHFSRSYRRRLPAEVLADAVSDLTGVPDAWAGLPPGSRAVQAWTYKIESQFLDAFGRPNSSSDCPCERDARPSIVQSLHLMNSRNLQSKLAHSEGRARRLADSELKPEEIVAELYLACFSRFPTGAESERAAAPIRGPAADRRAAVEDVLWALINSAEFVFNH